MCVLRSFCIYTTIDIYTKTHLPWCSDNCVRTQKNMFCVLALFFFLLLLFKLFPPRHDSKRASRRRRGEFHGKTVLLSPWLYARLLMNGKFAARRLIPPPTCPASSPRFIEPCTREHHNGQRSYKSLRFMSTKRSTPSEGERDEKTMEW